MDYTKLEMAFKPDADELLTRLGLEADSDEAEDFLALLDRLAPFGRPKAAALRAPVEEADTATGRVTVGGATFSSKLLASNIKDCDEVWPHVITCGRELYDVVQAIADPFEKYWGDEIMQAGLSQARAAMLQALEKDFRLGKVATMGPGSLPEWPIGQQEPLFGLLAEGVAFTGVELTPTMLMLPNKSVSGILFRSEKGWESCVLCQRGKCPNRRAEYNPEFALEH